VFVFIVILSRKRGICEGNAIEEKGLKSSEIVRKNNLFRSRETGVKKKEVYST